MDKTLRRTLTTTTLDHLARNNMLREVGRFNGVKYVSNTSDSFSVLGKAKLQNRGGGIDRLPGVQGNGDY